MWCIKGSLVHTFYTKTNILIPSYSTWNDFCLPRFFLPPPSPETPVSSTSSITRVQLQFCTKHENSHPNSQNNENNSKSVWDLTVIGCFRRKFKILVCQIVPKTFLIRKCQICYSKVKESTRQQYSKCGFILEFEFFVLVSQSDF